MISVIILTWNSEKYIEQCIRHLVESAKVAGEKLEIIVVDNGSRDATLRLIEDMRKNFTDVTLISLPKNMGTTYTRNLALKKAKGEYILFLDSDVEMGEDSIAKLLLEIKNHNKIGIISPKLVYPNGALQMSFKKFPTLKTKIFKILAVQFAFFKILADKDELYKEQEENLYPDYCISACWLVRKKVFKEVGFLDEKIFYAPEDVDFCLRIWLQGYQVLYFPFASATHHAQRVSYKSKKIALSHVNGLIYFFNKYRCWFSRNEVYRKIKYAGARSRYRADE